jgi:hypothetical protein
LGAFVAGRRRRTGLALLVALLLGAVPALAGCSSDDPYDPNDPAWVRAEEQHLLDLRAKAIRNDDFVGFMQVLATGDRKFVARERRYFKDLTQLPLARFSYHVLAGHWPRQYDDPSWGSGVRVPRVQLTMQLRGFDRGPSRALTGFAFGVRDGELKIIDDRAAQNAYFPGYEPQPWDVAPFRVVRQGGVLGLFDRRTYADAYPLMNVVADGVDQVQQAVPFAWNGRVVFYSFASRRLLDSFADVPGGNIEHLGALTFPVYATQHDRKVVGMRFTLLPSSVRAGEPFLGRIVRHELTHVAVGKRDDGAPVWFAEGLAEYVGARPLSRAERRIASVALTRAREPIGSMPASATFNGPDQDWHYALSWMACDYIAASRGESTLWALMDAFHNGGAGTPDGRQDAVLRRVLGYGGHELALRAAARIRAIYG